MFSKETVDKLLQPNHFGFIDLNEAADELLGVSYIPSMNWYVVVNLRR
jgi:hypothetical protein